MTNDEIMSGWVELQEYLHANGVLQRGIPFGHPISDFVAPHSSSASVDPKPFRMGGEVVKCYNIQFRVGGLTQEAVNFYRKSAVDRLRDVVKARICLHGPQRNPGEKSFVISDSPKAMTLIWREIPDWGYWEDNGDADYYGIPNYVKYPIKMGSLYFRFGVTDTITAKRMIDVYESHVANMAPSDPLDAPPCVASHFTKPSE